MDFGIFGIAAAIILITGAFAFILKAAGVSYSFVFHFECRSHVVGRDLEAAQPAPQHPAGRGPRNRRGPN